MGTAAVSAVSLLAVVMDKARNQRRAMSFLFFLLLVWTIQVLVFVLIFSSSLNFSLLGGSLTGLPPGIPPLGDPKIAMAKWAEFDQEREKSIAQISWSVEGNKTEFPWLVEFPPLGSEDEKPTIRTASVILAAHNEHQYLERTIDSIIAESDPKELVEIIIVDDASEPPLEEITKKMNRHQDKVKIIRHDERQGLIRSKTVGARASLGDLVIFLDAHVKPEKNWLGPLFRHTNINYKRVVVPLIPILNGETWTVDTNAIGIKMMFDWGLGFNWFDDGNDWVPVMSGGLLAITRRYWYESGEYDDKMLFWGGENIEQSVRIWLCGGEIVVARDSRVSHVFRPSFPYSLNHTQVNVNKVRTVEVWFDAFKEYYYRSDPFARTLIPYMGETTDRERLKERLMCKPFQYFVDRFRSVFDTKNMLPKRHVAIKDEVTGLCVEATKDGHLQLEDCKNAIGTSSKSAMRFVLDSIGVNGGTIRSFKHSNKCFDANGSTAEKHNIPILVYHCFDNNGSQLGWKLENGGIAWNNHYCAHRGLGSSYLVFGNCIDKDGEKEFLGTKFHGHANHKFVSVDPQDMYIAKTDADIKRDDEN